MINHIDNVEKFEKTDKAKSCPFCGNDEIILGMYQHAAGKRWLIACSGCLACIDPGYAQEKSVVIDMWNKRA